jgi:hypothetical protein
MDLKKYIWKFVNANKSFIIFLVNVQLTYHITLIYCELWQFPLLYLDGVDQWHNGIHIAYCITSQCWQKDLTPWMHTLNEHQGFNTSLLPCPSKA